MSVSCAVDSDTQVAPSPLTNSSPVSLAEHLLEKGLTIVGTLRQNKPDIPPVMKASRSREVHSTEFGFNGSMTMISYVRKKGKAVLLLQDSTFKSFIVICSYTTQ